MTKSPKKTGLQRESTTDQYYTHPHVVKQCMDLVCEHVNIDTDCDMIMNLVLGGAFVALLQIVQKCAFYDIEQNMRMW